VVRSHGSPALKGRLKLTWKIVVRTDISHIPGGYRFIVTSEVAVFKSHINSVPGEQPQSAILREVEPEVAVNPCGERLHRQVD
jgi:hypothetical protein